MAFKSPVKALLVEDTEGHALILSTILRSFHVEITLVKNGKEAVDLFLEGKKFDIVFCDNEMPVMAGPEVF
jgi:CheY-like chemotaxis protein